MANGTIAFDTLQTSGQITGSAKSLDTDYVVSGVNKAWVRIDGIGTAGIDSSFNFSSLTDNGTGDYSVTITNAMSSVDTYYVIEGQYVNSANTSGAQWSNSTASLVRFLVKDSSATDRDPVGFACIGDLA